MMKLFALLGLLLMMIIRAESQTSFKDTMFWQEYHEAYPVSSIAKDNNVKSIAVDKQLNVWIATAAGVLRKRSDTKTFENIFKGSAYNVSVDNNETVWMGTWKGVFAFEKNQLKSVAGTNGPVAVLCIAKEGVYAAGPNGVWLYDGKNFQKKNYVVARSIRSMISDNNEGLWIGTDVGLYHCNKNGVKYFHKTDVLVSAYIKAFALDNDNKLWAGGLGGVTVLHDEQKEKIYTTKDGCPSVYITCVDKNNDGSMWVGTQVGIVRYAPDGTHSLRFSRRWLLDDHVNDIAFDKDGNAWIATEQGVSAIKKKRMNLAVKQDYFYDVLMKRHIREPWIAGQCHLKVPGDTTSYFPEDDDNDGEYTSNYLAMEAFRYAITKDEDAKQKARKAFDFLKQLQTVTGSGGYFARTIVPVAWKGRVHDGNEAFDDERRANELVNEPRFKPVEERWKTSADGQWLWKGDASSDEMCGHMMGYYFYYELIADNKEKQRVSKHVASIVDHLIAHDYNMIDTDSLPTRWAVWSPDKLNRDAEWKSEQGENSMEILAFLKLAYYMTHDEKYQQHYLHLIHDEHYLDNMAEIKNQNPAWFIYFDVIMQAYLYPILLRCETDPGLLSFYQKHIDAWMEQRKADKNPLINFIYCYATNRKVELNASAEFLTDTPLDLINWTIDHTKREDVKITREPVLEDVQIDQLPPASIRTTVRWDKNPWTAISGSPDIEREPVFWLLPYWMGRYLKMIE